MTGINPRKLWLARVLGASGVSSTLLRLRASLSPSHLRIVNYHGVRASEAPAFERQLRFLAGNFHRASVADLRGLLRGEWSHPRPGILVTFDDGLLSHYEVAAPLLEKYGFEGWFFVPAALPGMAVSEQAAFAANRRLATRESAVAGRVGMNWTEVRDLAERHVVGCHTLNHCRLLRSLSEAELREEIAGARERMEHELGRAVNSFCWVGGEEESYSAAAADSIRAAGFEFGFMTNNAVVRSGTDPLQLQRTNLEADFSPSLTRFQLSGLLDMIYLPKRRRVNRLTARDHTASSDATVGAL